MRRFGLLFALALLTGCGDGELLSENPAPADQIANVSVEKEAEVPVDRTILLAPVTRQDMEREGLVGAGCDFAGARGPLLVSVADDAIARVGGELIHLIPSGPVGETGGFFEAGLTSLSVGRTSDAGEAMEEGRSWPARLTVTNRRTGAQSEIQGVWACGA